MYYATTPIDYTTGLIIAFCLLIVLWCLIKLEQRKEAKEREKILDDIESEMKKK
ncbi:MAG: hypothetical protein HZA04_10895 [Nitrospinae bacterium]|nr:hypothetical protein [Nitrospinota bacterium]